MLTFDPSFDTARRIPRRFFDRFGDPVFGVDSREQRPWTFRPFDSFREAHPFGDYWIRQTPDALVVERKSAIDFVLSMSANHDEEFAKVERAADAKIPRAYIVEGTWTACCDPRLLRIVGYSPSVVEHATPNHLRGAVLKLFALGVPVWFAKDRPTANWICRDVLLRAWQRAVANTPLRSQPPVDVIAGAGFSLPHATAR